MVRSPHWTTFLRLRPTRVRHATPEARSAVRAHRVHPGIPLAADLTIRSPLAQICSILTDVANSAHNWAPVVGTQTLARGLQILEFLVQEAEPQRPSDIARATGFDRSAVYRLLRELESHSLVARSSDSGRYQIGHGLIALAAVVLKRVETQRLARPLMEALGRATGETISLHIRNGRRRTCIETYPSRQAISRVIPIGESVPLFLGPTSKAILAFLDDAERESIAEDARTCDGAQYAAIAGQLERIRANGYIALVGDRAPGVGGLSAPVFDGEGVIGAITISGPSSRWTQQVMEDASGLLISACADLSALLGYHGSAWSLASGTSGVRQPTSPDTKRHRETRATNRVR